jgi:hypothetical protein
MSPADRRNLTFRRRRDGNCAVASRRHVDRALKGEKPAETPVQAPTKYELLMKTAKD